MCRPLYIEPDYHPIYNDKFMLEICTVKSNLQRTLLYSLLNVILNYDPVGTGIMSYIPFSSTTIDDPRERHVDTCCHALLVLLDYAVQPPDPSTFDGTANHPISKSEKEKTNQPTTTANNTAVPINQYHYHLRLIQKEEDFNVIYYGIERLLNNIPEAMNTYIPNSMKQIQSYQEILTLLWQCIDINAPFRSYIINQKSCEKLIMPCLYIMLEFRKLPAYSGLLHLCTFILLHLSGERNFGVLLNKPMLYSLPVTGGMPKMSSKDAPYGTHVDLCIITFHKMIVDGMVSLQSLYNCMLTVLSNMSPYIKTMSLISR
jgi:hypothetical protein